MTILLKIGSTTKPVNLQMAVFGKNGYLYVDNVQIGGNRIELAEQLERIAAKLRSGTVSQQTGKILQDMPKELEQPETAWPWLVQRFPWLFSDIDTSREPYKQYLKSSHHNSYNAPDFDLQLKQDLQAIAHLANPTQADVAEILFGDRLKTGGSYRRRILRVMQQIATTTTPDVGPRPVVTRRAAA
jgi:hypothetical protein